MKECRSCKKTKPVNDFNFDKSSRDGRYRYCRDCNKDMCKKWHKKNMIPLDFLGRKPHNGIIIKHE